MGRQSWLHCHLPGRARPHCQSSTAARQPDRTGLHLWGRRCRCAKTAAREAGVRSCKAQVWRRCGGGAAAGLTDQIAANRQRQGHKEHNSRCPSSHLACGATGRRIKKNGDLPSRSQLHCGSAVVQLPEATPRCGRNGREQLCRPKLCSPTSPPGGRRQCCLEVAAPNTASCTGQGASCMLPHPTSKECQRRLSL